MFHLFVASLDFLHQDGWKNGLNQLLADRSLIWGWISGQWQALVTWLSQPNVYPVVFAWWITFTVVVTIALSLGFGPAGIVTGSLAAAFQSWMYGGFTPAAGIFATLTSVGMLGLAAPIFAIFAASVATSVAGIVWLCMK